jgi:signal transduction histidine kinase
MNNTKSNILVVDDTPGNLRLLVGLLKENGYEVRPAPSGESALLAAQGIPPDLILLDIMMPGMDGYEVCKELKASDKTKDIPVIFISAINEVLDKVKAFEVGGVDYITKPFQVEEVLARVKTHLALQELQKSLQDKNDDLEKTLQQLQATQEELIQAEKMAALGQLVASIAHEINTPLGAISASAGNIDHFFTEQLEKLPRFLQQLSPEQQQDFFSLLHRATQQQSTFSTREKRQVKRELARQLQYQEIENADELASTLIYLGVYDNVEPFFQLLKDPENQTVLNTVDQLASAQRSTKTIITAVNRAAKVVFALKSYARYGATSEKVEATIADGIETALTLYHSQLHQGVEVVRNYEESLPSILCYADELNQVWTNLVHNALQAMNNTGSLTINATRQDSQVRVSITDSGKGIPPEIQPKIFKPFFTTKSIGEGSGLGLYIVKKIIDKHSGTIAVDSIPGKTTFTVSLPIN